MSMNPRLLRPTASGFSPRSISGLALWLDAASDTLYTTDAGPVVAVAQPTDIAGCVGWWDSSDLSAMRQNSDGTGAVAAGDPVGWWLDKSATGATVTGSGSARPTLSATGFNSRQALVFNGSSTNLSNALYTATNSLSGMTRIAVCSNTNQLAFMSRVYDGGGDSFLLMNASWRTYTVSGANFSSTTIPGAVGSSAPAGVYADVFASSAMSMYALGASLPVTVAGTIAATTAAGSPALHIGSNIGANGFWNGPIAEYIIFNRALTRTELARVEAYLAAKWGISGVHAPATATSDPVGYWGDKSGNGRHAVQATAGSRPAISAAAINSRNALLLDGSNDLLNLGNLASAFPSAATLFVACAPQVGAGATTSWSTFSTGGNSWEQYPSGVTYSSVFRAARVNAVPTILPYNGAAYQGSSIIIRYRSSSSGWGQFVNGGVSHIAAANYSAAVNNSAIGYTIGADTSGGNTNGPFKGRICEVLAYNESLSDSQCERIERWLSQKWSASFGPRVSNPDAQDWIRRVYLANGTVSSATATAVNTFCESIESAGIRDRFYRLNLFCGSFQGAFVPLFRGPSLSGTQYGGTTDTNLGSPAFLVGDYTETGVSGGLLGNGTSKYLNTAFNVDQLPGAANCHLSSFITGTQDIASARTLVGVLFNGVTDRYRLFLQLSGSTAPNYGIQTELGKANSAAATNRTNTNGGLILASRTSTTLLTLYDDAVSIGTTETSTAETTGASPFFVFARNGPTEFYNGRMAAYSIGAGMTAAQVTAYNTAMQAFQTAMTRIA